MTDRYLYQVVLLVGREVKTVDVEADSEATEDGRLILRLAGKVVGSFTSECVIGWSA